MFCDVICALRKRVDVAHIQVVPFTSAHIALPVWHRLAGSQIALNALTFDFSWFCHFAYFESFLEFQNPCFLAQNRASVLFGRPSFHRPTSAVRPASLYLRFRVNWQDVKSEFPNVWNVLKSWKNNIFWTWCVSRCARSWLLRCVNLTKFRRLESMFSKCKHGKTWTKMQDDSECTWWIHMIQCL